MKRSVPSGCKVANPKRGLLRSRRGLTIVEILIAALVSGVALAGILGAISFSFNTTQQYREVSEAVNILEREMERLRTLSYEEIQDLDSEPEATVNAQGGTKEYTLSYAVASFTLPSAGTTHESGDWLRIVTLTVSWTSTLNGRAMSRSLTGYFCNGGLNTL